MPDYLDVATAKKTPGLRLVLTAGVPGPWSEAAKGLFFAKGLPYAPVLQEGGGENAELSAWTGHANAPQAIYEDEPARCSVSEIILLAERLAPKPALVPTDPRERAAMFGFLFEITGEQGLGWCRRLMMLDPGMRLAPEATGEVRPLLERLAARYGYTPESAEAAPARVAEILTLLAAQLAAQHEAGSRFLLGDALSALDIYFATFMALIRPLPHELCPMPEALRAQYGNPGPVVEAALSPALLEHREAIYRDFLSLPLDF